MANFLKTMGLAALAAAIYVSSVQGEVMGNYVNELTPKTFNTDVLQNELPAVVMFYTEACPYCRLMEPIIEDVCKELKGKVYCGAYNKEQPHDTLSQRYRIDGVPVFGLFHDGETNRAEWIEGAVPESVLKEKIEDFIESTQ